MPQTKSQNRSQNISQNRTQLHFVTGKGGVGKSTYAAALTSALGQTDGPVLLIEVQGSGRSLELGGLKTHPFENTALPQFENAWGSRIMPKDSFKQYFGLLLALGQEQSLFGQVTSGVRSRIVDMVIDNKIVSAFVDVCPGLEPSVLLGKIHFEATEGVTPETGKPWKHVVVDAPATGHGLMLFKSVRGLSEVFGSGPVFKQANAIMDLVRNPDVTCAHIVSTLEELPLQEGIEIQSQLSEIPVRTSQFIVNRMPPLDVVQSGHPLDSVWQREVEFERDASVERKEMFDDFCKKIGGQFRILSLPEIFSDNVEATVTRLSKQLVTTL